MNVSMLFTFVRIGTIHHIIQKYMIFNIYRYEIMSMI